MEYQNFINSKRLTIYKSGFEVLENAVNPMLFDYQRDLVKWSLRVGKAALFTMTGTGKTLMQVEWAKHVQKQTRGKILIIAPLAVNYQTIREGKKIGVEITYAHNQGEATGDITITNYERLSGFDADAFAGVVLDESSILKSFTSATRDLIITMFARTPYKLSCTATPSPNDFMELGNQSEFLNVMTRTEMLAMFFVHDGGDTSKWRLKGHAESKFWEWVASWAAVLTKPSDLGYDDTRHILPPLEQVEHIVESDIKPEGSLFSVEAQTLQERQAARRDTIGLRAERVAEIVNATEGPFLIWCDLNNEAAALVKLIPGSAQVQGSDTPEQKEARMMAFADSTLRVLISKPSICGFGMNWQHCSQMAFIGLSDSFEAYFQAVRRCYRFGQKKPVTVHIVISDLEGAVLANIKRKESNATRMLAEIVEHTRRHVLENIRHQHYQSKDYNARMEMKLPIFLQEEA